MFAAGDKIVYPMYGACVLEDVRDDEVLGVTRPYYVMKLAIGSMNAMVPVAEAEQVGLRYVISPDEARAAVEHFNGLEVGDVPAWNRRYRENAALLRRGDIESVCYVFKSLFLLDRQKGLSANERKMLTLARQIFFSEISLALDTDAQSVERLLKLR